MIPVVVLTCARPEEGEPFRFLARSLAQMEFERAGGAAFRPIVVCDNTRSDARPTLPAGWELVSYTKPDGSLPGNKLPYWEALRVALDAGGDGGIVFEDDVDLCGNALRRMCTFPIPSDLAFVMFYAPAVFQAAKVFPGLWRTPTAVIGTQAIKFTRDVLQRLWDFRTLDHFMAYTASDQILDHARVLLRLKYGAHCPEIVQHVGDESAVDYGADLSNRWRHSVTFVRQLDAMSLYSRDELFR